MSRNDHLDLASLLKAARDAIFRAAIKHRIANHNLRIDLSHKPSMDSLIDAKKLLQVKPESGLPYMNALNALLSGTASKDDRQQARQAIIDNTADVLLFLQYHYVDLTSILMLRRALEDIEQSTAPKTSAPVQRLHDPDEDARIAQEWERAREAGVPKKQFVKGRRDVRTCKDLNRLLARVRMRRQTS